MVMSTYQAAQIKMIIGLPDLKWLVNDSNGNITLFTLLGKDYYYYYIVILYLIGKTSHQSKAILDGTQVQHEY